MIRLVALFPILAVALGATLDNFDYKIVGGEEVDIKNYPYMVSLQFIGRHSCGGSIIGSKFILTAAHCTLGWEPEDLSIRVGSSFHDHGGDLYKVQTITIHPEYNTTKYFNDISILELEDEIVMGDGVSIIATATEEPEAGETATVSGWGRIKEGSGDNAPQLIAVQVPIIDREECRQTYGNWRISDNMICAGGLKDGGKDACQNDSGGPLVVNGKLVGVVSWGRGCGRPSLPGVYANVAGAHEFIASMTGL